MSLVPVDTTSALAVSDYLDRARTWLATAVEMTGPAEIAMARAEIATAAEAAKQLGLSKDIREDATEMVRRAEYAVSRSVKKGQDAGLIRTQGKAGGHEGQLRADSEKLPAATTFVPDLYFNGSEIASLGGVEPELFEQAMDDAKAEGNLSRANIVRKIKQTNPDRSRSAKADVIEDLAAQGFTSKQMADRVGVSDARVRDIAREFDIDIAADRVVGKQRRLDHTQMVDSSVTDIENATEFIESFIDLAEVDFTGADEWVSSLSNSIAALTRFRKQIKEKTHHV